VSARPKYAWDSKKLAPVAIIQASAHGFNTVDGKVSTIHWAGAPQNGNLLICSGVVYNPGGLNLSAIVANGWTILVSTSPFFATYIAYKYANNAAQVDHIFADQGGAAFGSVWALTAWEISGVSGNIGTDITHTTLSDATQRGPVAVITPGNINTQAATKLALLSLVGYTGLTGATMVWSGGATSDAADYSSPNADIANGLFDYGSPAHQVCAGVTAINPTITPSQNAWWYYTLIELA